MLGFLFEKREITIASVIVISIVVSVIVKLIKTVPNFKSIPKFITKCAHELKIEFLVFLDFFTGYKYYDIGDCDSDDVRQYSVVRIEKCEFPDNRKIHSSDSFVGDMVMIWDIKHFQWQKEWVLMRVRKYKNQTKQTEPK